MKRLQASIVFSLLSLLMVTVAWAQTPIARVAMINGNVFAVTDGKTMTLKDGDYLYRGSQVISEEGTSMVISDFFNHKIILSGATDIEVFNNDYKLNRGYVWIQSSHLDQATFKTANSIVTFSSGDAILSFDPANDRTQLMTINGRFSLANALEPMVTVDVGDGTFSFIDNEYDGGVPRNPTNVGESSYVKLISLFKGINPPEKREVPSNTASRSIASVGGDKSGGKIIVRKSVSRAPSSINSSNNKLTKNEIPITVFRMPSIDGAQKIGKTETQKSVDRAPASVKEVKPVITPKITVNKDFESSLMDAYKKQRRHDGEVMRLIEELETYDQDYKQDY